uniref:Uncharacterized protein n=1 Tax=Cacopsylla melanoneura TaxID=428564 RepID=A0A8D8M009_9HEMI
MTSTNKKKPNSIMDDNKTLDLLLDSTASLNVTNSEKSSDEDIKKLLKKMENLLSPHDQSVFDSNGNKSVGDILKAADDLIHSTSPLFEALSPIGSHQSSGNSQNISSKSFKIDIPQLPLYNKPCSLSSNHEMSHVSDTMSSGRESNNVTEQNNTSNTNIISKQHLTLNIENKLTPDVIKHAENVDEETKIAKQYEENHNNENKIENNINKEFHFQDIGNVVPLKRTMSSASSKSHTKFDKHRQLNIKPDGDKRVKSSQVISKHKPETSRMKSSSSDTKIKQNKQRVESKKTTDLNNREKTDQANLTPNSISNDYVNMNDDFVDKSKMREQNTVDPKSEANFQAFSFQRLQSLSVDSPLLQSNRETENDRASDIHSLTRTLSPTEEARPVGVRSNTIMSPTKEARPAGLRSNTATIYEKELKMSDLVTPSQGTNYSLEQELEIQRNKVRQLKEELNATLRAHLQQMEFLKISHEEEMVMMKRQMKIEQETELKRRLLSQTPGLDKATTPLDDHLLSSYDKENKRLCQELKGLKTEFREAENKWLEEKSKLILQLNQNETDSLKKQLKEARMKISSLEQTIHVFKVKEEDGGGDSSDVIQKLEHQNFQLMNEICELTNKINDSNMKAADIVQSKDEEVRNTILE